MAAMEHTATRPAAAFSIGDTVTLACAAVLGFAFSSVPWFTVSGQDVTGLNLLSNRTPALQNYAAGIFFIPIAAVIGILAGLWGLVDARSRRYTASAATLAGILGLLYFVVFLFLNNQLNVTGLFGPAFGIAGLMVIGLLLQNVLPHPITLPQYNWRDYFAITRIGIFSVL